jgi:hypothetical protein
MIEHKNVVTVLDYSTGEVHIYRYPDSVEDIEQFIKMRGHNLKDICFMCTDDLILQVHQSE